jgi:hypothetical protein
VLERALVHVVEDELIGEGVAVPHEHRDVPGQGDGCQDRQPARNLERNELPPPRRGGKLHERDRNREGETRWTLAEGGHCREAPGTEQH